jgi:hypothetical protein
MRQTGRAAAANLISASFRIGGDLPSGLLMNTYCRTDAAEQSRWSEDDMFQRDGFELLTNTAQISCPSSAGSDRMAAARHEPAAWPLSR